MPTNKKKGNKKKGSKSSRSSGDPPPSSSGSLGGGENDPFMRMMAQLRGAGPDLTPEQMSQITQGGGFLSDEDIEQIKAGTYVSPDEKSRFQDDPKTRKCDHYGCKNKGKYMCSRCKCRAYCGRDCQKAAFDEYHKQECKLLVKCGKAPDLVPDFVQDEVSTSLGVARTKNHGAHVYCCEKLEYHGNESNRLVPIASVKIESENPTNAELTTCLVNAILYPEFDTICVGVRRPHKITIHALTIGSTDLVARIARVAVRLGCVVQVPDSENEDSDWDFSWFCVQNGWNEELTDPVFSALIEPNRKRPMISNGSARTSAKKVIQKQNKQAAGLPRESLPGREQVIAFPRSKDMILNVAVSEGVLYVFTDNRLLYHRRVVLNETTGRPHIQDVLGPLYKAMVMLEKRPFLVSIGQPSVCILSEVDAYDDELDSLDPDGGFMSALAEMNFQEDILKKTAIPAWRRAGLLS